MALSSNILRFCLVGNVLLLADPKQAYLDRKLTYFSPAIWVYALWPAIHILTLGTVIYQFFQKGKKVIVDGFGWRFPLLFILSSAYIALWTQKRYVPAFVLAFLVNGSVTHIFYVIRKKNTGKSINGARKS